MALSARLIASFPARDEMLALSTPKRTPWNKEKLTGAKAPLRPKHLWAIRTKLQVEGRRRDFAMFNQAIDSKLRGCDVVAPKIDDVDRGSGVGQGRYHPDPE
jgi:hypothetical protein